MGDDIAERRRRPKPGPARVVDEREYRTIVAAPAHPRPRRKVRALVIAGIVAVAGAGAVAGAAVAKFRGGGTAKDIIVRGTFTLVDPDEARAWSTANRPCKGGRGYGDLRAGAAVVISDETGSKLAVTTLGIGKTGAVSDSAGRCTFAFTTTVPAGRTLYGVTVTHHRTVRLDETEIAEPALLISA